MALEIVNGPTRSLFEACADRFFIETAGSSPARAGSYLWITHRLHRDALLAHAEIRGVKGWLGPPVSFFSKLPEQFGITGTPIGLLTRRRIISRLAAQRGRALGIAVVEDSGVVRGHMLDSLIGELLPEAVSPDALAAALGTLELDDFATRRNQWIHDVYVAYLAELASRGLYDARSIHALIAAAIDAGYLSEAIRGAPRLHVYGMYSLRTRRRLVDALRRQDDVAVTLYIPHHVREFDVIQPRHELSSGESAAPLVQPAPDPLRELQWVAGRVKQLLVDGGVEPHEIAIVARSGREDTRRVCVQLEAAGVPFSARVRRPLAEIPIVGLILEVFRGVAEGWSYATIRTVAASSYTNARVSTDALDVIAERSRPRSLGAWNDAFARLHAALLAEDPNLARSGLFADRVQRDAARMASLCTALEPLAVTGTELQRVTALRDWLRADPLSLRRRLSRPPFGRYEVVRFDQRGLNRLVALLDEWSDVADDDRVLHDVAWYRLLRRLLAGEELALTTPGQKGVQVLEAHDAALVPFRHAFLVHMNDGEFPVHRATGGVLTEEERSVLAATGLPIEDRALATLREQALWHAVTAAENVTVTYRTTDPIGTPLLPSMLVPPHDETTELPRSLEIRSAPCTAEQVRQTAAEALKLGGDAVESAEHAVVRRAIVIAHAEQSRGAPERMAIDRAHQDSPWNGVLRDPAVLAVLESRFGAEHAWSASQLEKYGRCPFLYLVDRVLSLRSVEEADEETTPLDVGSIAHDVLEQYYGPYAAAGTMAERSTLEPAIDAVFAKRESSGQWLGAPALWRVTRAKVRRMLIAYVEWELDVMLEEGERPYQCERKLDDPEPALITGRDVKGNAVSLLLRGRIDRIDIDGSGRYRVLDYKTSSVPFAKRYSDGALIQAALYTEALRQIEGLNVVEGRYRALKKPGGPKNGAAIKFGTSKYDTVLQIAFSIPARIRAGRFESLMAASDDWQFFDPDPSICRTRAAIAEGTRFDV